MDEFSKVLEKLIETVERGVTGYFKPAQIRRVGKAEAEVEAYKALTRAQTERQIEAVRSGQAEIIGNKLVEKALQPKRESDLLAGPGGTDRVQDIARVAIEARTDYEVDNLAKVLTAAAHIAQEQTGEPSPDPVSFDWYMRWQKLAQETSDIDIQQLWARLLVAEVERPSSISHRTLIVMSQLSRAEADLIQRLAPFVGQGNPGWVHKNKKVLEAHALGFGDFLKLETMGIVQSVGGIGGAQQIYELPPDRSTEAHIWFEARGLQVRRGRDQIADKQLSFEIYPLTTAGWELCRLATAKANMDAVVGLGRELVGHGFEVHILARSENNAEQVFILPLPPETGN